MNTDETNKVVTHFDFTADGRVVWCGVANQPKSTKDPHKVTCADCRRRMPRDFFNN